VKIAKGANKGKTLVGIIIRSLKPDRKKYPYLIIFNDNDKQTNEKVSKIPSTGIELFKEPIPSTQGNKGRGKEKANAKGKRNKGKKGNKNPLVTNKKTPLPTNVRRSARNK
jgi:hypothetical protein